MAEADDDRTEPATAKRRNEYRERGEVAKSRDLAAAFGLLATLSAMAALAQGIAESLRSGARVWLSSLDVVAQRPIFETLGEPLGQIALNVSPLILVAALAGAIGHLVQTGFLFVPKALEFDLNKLNPLPRLQGIFSVRGLGELAKGIVKLGLVGVVVYEVVRGDIERLRELSTLPIGEASSVIASVALRALAWGGFCLFVLGAAEFFLLKYQMEKKMRMTKQEVRDEFKQEEGDPHVKGRIRGKMRSLAKRRMMEAVKTADVVVTNPTHLAVAISYRAGEMGAPRVVAKGGDKLAERIKAIAREAGVPVLENKPLARALFKAVEIGQEIPAALYKAVAEVLAFVYARGRGAPKRAEVT